MVCLVRRAPGALLKGFGRYKRKEQTLKHLAVEEARGLFFVICVYGASQTLVEPILLFLVTVLSETFFALVCSHLVAFSFLSAGHDKKNFTG